MRQNNCSDLTVVCIKFYRMPLHLVCRGSIHKYYALFVHFKRTDKSECSKICRSSSSDYTASISLLHYGIYQCLRLSTDGELAITYRDFGNLLF